MSDLSEIVFCHQQGIATYSRTDAWRSRTANVNAKRPSPWRRPGCEQRTIGRPAVRVDGGVKSWWVWWVKNITIFRLG